MSGEKLHKLLAGAGLGSRRQIEKWVADGRVRVDGQTAHVGMRVGPGVEILVDGKPVELRGAGSTRVLIYHKPLGEISTRSDPRGRPTVFDRLPAVAGRWISVGRLDVNTSGLLLFTNDGALAAMLMHPSSGFEREYTVRVHGAPEAAQLEMLKTGVQLDGAVVRFNAIEALGQGTGRNRRYRVTVSEGRYREVRRLWQSVGCEVNQLRRTRFGPVTLPGDLAAGSWRDMERGLVDVLKRRPAVAGACG